MSEKTRKRKNAERIVFVVAPLGDPNSSVKRHSDQILRYVIEPVVSEFGYKAVRPDRISRPGIITSQIIYYVINAPLVIADLTGQNPNVFYELAVRHATKKPVIQIIEKGEQVPFDVSAMRTIQVDSQDLDSVGEAKRELKRQIEALEKNPTPMDSPISEAFAQGNLTTQAKKTLDEVVSKKIDEITQTAAVIAIRRGSRVVTEDDVKEAIKRLEEERK